MRIGWRGQLSSHDLSSGSSWTRQPIKGSGDIFIPSSTLSTNHLRRAHVVVSDGGRACVCGSEWGWRVSGRAGSNGFSVSLFVVSQPLNMVSMCIYLGPGSKDTGPKGLSDL